MTSLISPWPGNHASGDGRGGFARVIQQIGRQLAPFAPSAQSEQAQLSSWISSNSSVTVASRDQMSLIARAYLLQGREAVLTFLERRPHLIPLLLEARSMIPLYFQSVPVALRLSEGGEDYGPQQLGLYILVPSNKPEESLTQLAAFDQEWWLDAIDRALGDLVITIAAA